MRKRSRRSKKGAGKYKRPKRAPRVNRTLATKRTPPDDEARVDGCDVDFNESDATHDEELPNAIGGVGTIAVRRKTR
jgi:hypothetical protein